MKQQEFVNKYGGEINGNKIKYYGHLDLRDTKITALPDNLTVGGSLDLNGTKITALPDNLTVGGGLDLGFTPITALPDNLTVGGHLNLKGTKITALPDNLTVGGSLDLNGTKITHGKSNTKLEFEIKRAETNADENKSKQNNSKFDFAHRPDNDTQTIRYTRS